MPRYSLNVATNQITELPDLFPSERPPSPTVDELRESKFQKRAQDLILLRAWFSAAINKRFDDGQITRAQMRALFSDPGWRSMQNALQDLEFEEAILAVDTIAAPIATAQIKTALKNRITAKLFND